MHLARLTLLSEIPLSPLLLLLLDVRASKSIQLAVFLFTLLKCLKKKINLFVFSIGGGRVNFILIKIFNGSFDSIYDTKKF